MYGIVHVPHGIPLFHVAALSPGPLPLPNVYRGWGLIRVKAIMTPILPVRLILVTEVSAAAISI